MRRFVTIFIATVFVLIVGGWILIGVVGVTVAKNPETVSEKVGKAAKSIKEGFEKGFYDEPDSTAVDSLNNELK